MESILEKGIYEVKNIKDFECLARTCGIYSGNEDEFRKWIEDVKPFFADGNICIRIAEDSSFCSWDHASYYKRIYKDVPIIPFTKNIYAVELL